MYRALDDQPASLRILEVLQKLHSLPLARVGGFRRSHAGWHLGLPDRLSLELGERRTQVPLEIVRKAIVAQDLSVKHILVW